MWTYFMHACSCIQQKSWTPEVDCRATSCCSVGCYDTGGSQNVIPAAIKREKPQECGVQCCKFASKNLANECIQNIGRISCLLQSFRVLMGGLCQLRSKAGKPLMFDSQQISPAMPGLLMARMRVSLPFLISKTVLQGQGSAVHVISVSNYDCSGGQGTSGQPLCCCHYHACTLNQRLH